MVPWRPEPAAIELGKSVGRQPSSAAASAASAASSILSLDSDLPADLLRAVPLDRCLRCCGHHWRHASGDAGDFQLSRTTESIDAFLSHDWQTPGSASRKL
eukprot:Skav206712  [mRNA]  locus=scaffold3267:22122:22424:+ [translate_table: standard]